MRQKRYPLLLDRSYPPERDMLGAINAVPEGERAGFLRALVLLGHQEIERDERERRLQQQQASSSSVERPNSDGT
jgi:hypothetical protein